MLSENQKKELLKYARAVIKAELFREKPSYELPDDDIYQEKCGAFVTLHKNGELRGCIGYIKAYKSIKDTIKDMAIAAAFNDPRFPPLQKEELNSIEIEISLLSELKKIDSINEIEVGKHGLYVERGYFSGLLLPQVATEWNWDKKTFLNQVCAKAMMPYDCWKYNDTEIYIFTAEIFSESDFSF